VSGVVASALTPSPAPAEPGASHGLSRFGTLRYPPDFRCFDYVNPEAPVGGTLSLRPTTYAYNQNPETFNSLNAFVWKGDAPVLMPLVFASLFASALDEPDAQYGLLARSVSVDRAARRYRIPLRPEATFHDGSRITAADVVWSLATLREKGHPQIVRSLAGIATLEAADAATVVLTLKPEAPRDLDLVIGALPVFSRADFVGKDFGETTLVPPLGSGGFKVGRFEPGRFVEFERVPDWWGWRLPCMVGTWNWGRVRSEFYRDADVEFQAFKTGAILLRFETSSRNWATGYDFPAARDGRVIREEMPDEDTVTTSGFWLNLRRRKFQDLRVREAIACAFDFEWTNRNLFHGQYQREASLFGRSDLTAAGEPSADELALLAPWRDSLPRETFGPAVEAPVSDGSGRDRALMRRAHERLAAAGVSFAGGQARLPGGERLRLEILDADPAFQRVLLPFVTNLGQLGIDASLRIVDPTQLQARTKAFDFDMLFLGYSFGYNPGEFLKRCLASSDAPVEGSSNLSGVAHPAVDDLVERVVGAASRAELVTAARALDRVVRALRLAVPGWTRYAYRIARWDVFARPPLRPRYAAGAAETWWIDPTRARRVGRGL
jgi:microcin C transport system substrate-binding protein